MFISVNVPIYRNLHVVVNFFQPGIKLHVVLSYIFFELSRSCENCWPGSTLKNHRCTENQSVFR